MAIKFREDCRQIEIEVGIGDIGCTNYLAKDKSKAIIAINNIDKQEIGQEIKNKRQVPKLEDAPILMSFVSLEGVDALINRLNDIRNMFLEKDENETNE